MNLTELIAGMDVRCVTQGVDLDAIRVCDLTEDSRTAVPGSLFIARLGTKSDGCRYIEPAIQCGCVAIVTDRVSVMEDIELGMHSKLAIFVADDVKQVGAQLAERFYGYPAKQLVIAGITGTNGKTTITHFAHQLIEAAGVGCGLIGTVEIDDGRQRARASMTTPPAVELSRTLATMVEHECKAVVMEVSSHALDQSRVGAIRFDACAFTNLTGDHLDYHQTIEHYQSSKAKLFGLLKPDGMAAINGDDHASDVMIDACTDGVAVVGRKQGESVRVLDESIEGMRVQLNTPIGTIESCVPIFGAYNAMNIFQAVLIAQHVLGKAGISEPDQIRAMTEELPHLTLPSGRLEHVESKDDDLIVLVDFAHTDDALGSALGAVRAVLTADSRLWCVFGCGGDRDATKRARMGAVAGELADSLVITSDNPRTEPPNRIIETIISGVDKVHAHKVNVQSDRARAISFAIANANAGDVVLIAGKGHETEQISPDGAGGTRSVHFDDREHAQRALRERRLRKSAEVSES
ncbi:UDP-N-acetylmuramoyl-L-alanyl-D-glutamate--2,6-diaminopimelate ligase [bacterium]|nr:MAG: UDP-N-acetylmuramoyl-L-alanyl-D-glutamate--2,6-diaminopimelate ligase [bacterium]